MKSNCLVGIGERRLHTRNGQRLPHICQALYREGGERVYVVGQEQLSEKEYTKRKKENPTFDKGRLRAMVRNPAVYVRGNVRHEDHATVQLAGWHRVFLN